MSTIIHKRQLISIIRIPLINVNSQFELFKIHTLYFPGKGTFGKNIARYDINEKGLAINKGRTEYIVMNSQEFTTCSSNIDNFCDIHVVKYLVGAKLHCVMSLFSSDNLATKSNCQVRIYPNIVLPQPMLIRNGVWAVATNITFKMTISGEHQDSHSITISPPLTMIHLNEFCFATSNYFIIPAQRQYESVVEIPPEEINFINNQFQNVSLWKPVDNLAKNIPKIVMPTSLKSMSSYHLDDLLHELNNIDYESAKQNEKTVDYGFLAYIVSGISIVLVIMLVGYYYYKKIRPFRKGTTTNMIYSCKINRGDAPIVKQNISRRRTCSY